MASLPEGKSVFGAAMSKIQVRKRCIKSLPGLHLEIDPRGGKMSIYEKEGGRSPNILRIK